VENPGKSAEFFLVLIEAGGQAAMNNLPPSMDARRMKPAGEK
jgi:hypothetical protein